MAKRLFISVILVTVASFAHSVDINAFVEAAAVAAAAAITTTAKKEDASKPITAQQHSMHKIKSRFACALRLFIDCVFELDDDDDDGNLFLV